MTDPTQQMSFQDAVRGLKAGDFSRLEPAFEDGPDGAVCTIIEWFEVDLFAEGLEVDEILIVSQFAKAYLLDRARFKNGLLEAEAVTRN